MKTEGFRAMLAGLPALLKARIASELDEAATSVAASMRLRLGRSGRLAESIKTGRDTESGAAVVTVDEPYAADLEYGTTRMAARPFLRPAAAEAEPNVRAKLAAASAEICHIALGGKS